MKDIWVSFKGPLNFWATPFTNGLHCDDPNYDELPEEFQNVSLLNPIVTTFSLTILSSICFETHNTFARVNCTNRLNMMS
jgi:hypothetical protein